MPSRTLRPNFPHPAMTVLAYFHHACMRIARKHKISIFFNINWSCKEQKK